MATTGEILTRVKAYRNTFTDAQIVNWMDTVQRQIFQDVPHEAPPFKFNTSEAIAFYPLPGDCDPLGVKQVTIERTPGSERYQTLDFLSVESNVHLDPTAPFYSVQGNENLFLNPLPTDTTAGKKVYIVYNKRPAVLSVVTLDAVPDLEVDFHELIELGAKARVARERGEVTDKNNFQADFNELFAKYVNRYSKAYPEYSRVKDVLPRRGRDRYAGRSTVSSLMPWQ